MCKGKFVLRSEKVSRAPAVSALPSQFFTSAKIHSSLHPLKMIIDIKKPGDIYDPISRKIPENEMLETCLSCLLLCLLTSLDIPEKCSK